MPIRASTGVKELGLRRETKRLPLSMPARLCIKAVTVVPMLAPMMMGIVAPMVTWPVEDRAWSIPTEAELDWIMAVSTAPASTPRKGLWNMRMICWNSGTSLRPDTAADMLSMPYISVAKPRRMRPVSCLRDFLLNI